jgi:hypothetical protein
MDRLPSRPRITDFSVTKFSDNDFRSVLALGYRREYGNDGIAEIKHVRLSWQHAALEFFDKRGLKIDKQKMLSPQQYKTYKARYGV